MLRVLPLMFKPVNSQICCKTGLMWVGKRATSLFNSFAAILQNKLRVFCFPFLRTLRTGVKGCSRIRRVLAIKSRLLVVYVLKMDFNKITSG